MAENSAIEWTDHTWSPWIGCTKISPACDGCYASHLMDTRLGRVEWGPHGERKRTSSGYWAEPAKWNRICGAAGRMETVFPSLCDPWDNQADPGVRREWFSLIRDTPHLVWLLLTKRPQNILRMVEDIGFMPPNIALGTTCEDQKRAELNVLPTLEAAYRLQPLFTFVSCEPLLSEMNLRRIRVAPNVFLDALAGTFSAETTFSGGLGNFQAGLEALPPLPERRPALGWVIVGGETDQGKHKARPSHPDWFRGLRDQCHAAGVPFLFKQNGAWLDEQDATANHCGPGPAMFDVEGRPIGDRWHFYDPHDPLGGAMIRVGKARAGRLLDGRTHDGMPGAANAR